MNSLEQQLLQQQINQHEAVIFDSNIWLFLFAPSFITPQRYQSDRYSFIFKYILENQNKRIFLTSTNISEFINRCLRNDFNKQFNLDDNGKSKNLDYKNDKDTVEYLIPINTSITINSILNFDDIYLVAGNDFNNHEKIEIKNIILDNDEWIEYINNCLEKAKK
jgi:hypothetical protein